VKTAGVASEAGALGGVTVPDAQVRLTVTLPALSSEKSLYTVNVPTAVLMIVQLLLAPSTISTLTQLV
jgi:hypothetical protein